jgi:hypothetical protein
LPAEYGGQIPSLDYGKLRNALYDNSEQLMGESKWIIKNIAMLRNLKAFQIKGSILNSIKVAV